MIHNIIGNSIKYLDKQRGLINIRIKDVGDFIQVEIEDNGRGIAAADLPYILIVSTGRTLREIPQPVAVESDCQL